MKSRIVSIAKEYKNILITLGVSCLFIFGIFIFFDRPFTFNPDQQNEYHVFYREWISLINNFITNGELPMYSWNSFLGADFYSTQSFYVNGDIFLPLIMMFESVEAGLLVESVLLVFISGISMNIFLKEFGIKDIRNRNFISIVYALSGWAVLFIGQYMFHRFYAFTPLLFFGLERYINTKKAVSFIVSVALLFVTCYYFMFQTSLFLFMYAIFTTVNRSMKIKSIVTLAFKLIFFFIIGFSISAFISFPAIVSLISNPRIGASSNDIFWQLRTYIGFILNQFAPYYNDFPKLFFASPNWHDSWYSLFIGFVPTILMASIVFKKEYKKYSIFLLALVVIMLFRPLSSIMHGFSEPSLRWTCLLVFYMLLMAAKALDDDSASLKKPFYIIVFLGLFSIAVGYLFGIITGDFNGNMIHIAFSTFIGIAIFYIFMKNRRIGMVFVIIHLVVNAAFTLYYLNREYYKYDETIKKKYIEYYRDIDDDLMYRMYVNPNHLYPTSEMNLNKSLDYGFMSTTSYNSVYDASIINFLKLNGYGSWHIFDLNSPDTMVMLGVKYYIVNAKEELPNSLEFEYVFSLEHLDVYKCLNFKGFGYTTNSVQSISTYNNLKQFEEIVFVDEVDFDFEAYKNVEETRFEIYEKGNNHLKGKIYSNTNNILFIPVPNNSGWKVLVNGEKINTVSVNGGFMGIPISSGETTVEMYFMSLGFKEGIIVSSIGIIALFVVILLESGKIKVRKKKL